MTHTVPQEHMSIKNNQSHCGCQSNLELKKTGPQNYPGTMNNLAPMNNHGPQSISFFGFDWSAQGEASYLYKRILSRKYFPYKRMIVDIGASDGLAGSNSVNFIQWGWNAILVEPQAKQIRNAKWNTHRYRDPYREGTQRVEFVQAVMGETDGFVQFALGNDDRSAHIQGVGNENMKTKQFIKVKSYTVAGLTQEYDIPKDLGVLSIDAEGMSYAVMRQWLDLGYRPGYIILEYIHAVEDSSETRRYIEECGYKLLTRIEPNLIYEMQP